MFMAMFPGNRALQQKTALRNNPVPAGLPLALSLDNLQQANTGLTQAEQDTP